MRNLLFVVVALLATLVSCSHESNIQIKEQNDEEAFVMLMNEISMYNAGFGVDTKAGGGFWRRLGRVAAADGLGFAVGSVGGPGVGLLSGIFSSFFAACRELMTATFTKTNSGTIVLSDDKLYSNSGLTTLTECDYMGEIHNVILEEIYEENPDCFTSFTDSQMLAAIQQKIKKHYPSENVSSSDINLSDTKQLVNAVLNPELTITQAFDKVRKQYPSKVAEINVIEQYCAAVSSIDDNETVKDYTDGFHSVLDDSTIDDSTKKSIKSTISVAGNSRLLWSECISEIER